ncbi:MAG TPA: hypothetical protein VN461_16485 [Vicinamibacteria bacterium]|nr:hypothetical protein [Vicinamibacteria bacterium]
MALIKVTLPTALPTVRQMIGELDKAIKETGGLPGLEAVGQGLANLEDYSSRKALEVEVVVVAPVAGDQAGRVAGWIGAGFPAAPLQARTVEPTAVELPGGTGLVPLRARIRSLASGGAVPAGTPRPAVLILLVGSPTALHPENMAALESLVEDRPSVVVIGPPDDPAVKQLDERAKASAWTALLGDVPATIPETSFQARLSVAPWDAAHDLFRAHSTVVALESLCGVFDIVLQQQARDLRTKKAATQAKIGKTGPGAAKTGPQVGADLIPDIKARIQRHSQEFERGAVERLQDLLGLAAGTLAHETEAMMLALDELDEREGTTKIECRIPPAFEQKLLKTIRDRVARHCAGDVVALNDLFRLLSQEIEREIAQAQGPPFVPHFAYLTEDRVRRMMDMSIAFQAQYRGEMPHHGFSEYFASVRKYSMILVMAASMFGMSSLMRQYREFTVPATILLVLIGTYSVISSTRQQRVENLEKELEAARTALRPDLKRIFTDVQKNWSSILLQHMNEQIASVLADVDTTVKDYQARRGAEASPEKERLTRQLTQLETAEKKLAIPLKSKEGIVAALAQVRGDLKPLLPKPGAPGAAKPAAAAAAPGGAPSSAIQDAKAKIEALKAQAAAGRPAAPAAKPAAAAPAAGPAKPSALEEAKAKFAALRAGAAKPAAAAATPPAGPAKPSALEEAKARFAAMKAEAAARTSAPAPKPAAATPPAKPGAAATTPPVSSGAPSPATARPTASAVKPAVPTLAAPPPAAPPRPLAAVTKPAGATPAPAAAPSTTPQPAPPAPVPPAGAASKPAAPAPAAAPAPSTTPTLAAPAPAPPAAAASKPATPAPAAAPAPSTTPTPAPPAPPAAAASMPAAAAPAAAPAPSTTPTSAPLAPSPAAEASKPAPPAPTATPASSTTPTPAPPAPPPPAPEANKLAPAVAASLPGPTTPATAPPAAEPTSK